MDRKKIKKIEIIITGEDKTAINLFIMNLIISMIIAAYYTIKNT